MIIEMAQSREGSKVRIRCHVMKDWFLHGDVCRLNFIHDFKMTVNNAGINMLPFLFCNEKERQKPAFHSIHKQKGGYEVETVSMDKSAFFFSIRETEKWSDNWRELEPQGEKRRMSWVL